MRSQGPEFYVAGILRPRIPRWELVSLRRSRHDDQSVFGIVLVLLFGSAAT